MSEVTQLLQDWNAGQADARDRLLDLVYRKLRIIAYRHLEHERSGHTLQPTALVHELYVRLADQRRVEWRDRAHFFAVAAEVMRRILIDHARRRKSEKRGGPQVLLTIDAALDVCDERNFDVLLLDLALQRLAAIFPQQAKLVELRFFGGLTLEETAEALSVSTATVSREWSMARAWLRRELSSVAQSAAAEPV